MLIKDRFYKENIIFRFVSRSVASGGTTTEYRMAQG
jgi:hypothetical protein